MICNDLIVRNWLVDVSATVAGTVAAATGCVSTVAKLVAWHADESNTISLGSERD